jgi:hypothetical protein
MERIEFDLLFRWFVGIGIDGRVCPWAVDATAELEYGRRIVFFRWSGFDEGDQTAGGGSAELQDGALSRNRVVRR